MAAPPSFEVSVKIRPITRGINSIFGVQEESNLSTVCNGVVACKSFTTEHLAKHPFDFDKVYVDCQCNERVFNVSARHIIHSAIAGGHGCITIQPSQYSNVGVSHDVIFGTSTGNFGLLNMTVIELLRHSSTGCYRIEFSATVFCSESQQEVISRTSISSLTDLITRTSPLNQIDPSKHLVIVIYVVGILGEGRVYLTRLGSTQYKQGLAQGSFYNVLTALSHRRNHIPYRESKVTRFLRSGLAPSSANLFLLLVDSAPVDFSRALSDLKMVDRLRGSCFPMTAGAGPATFKRELPMIRKTIGNGSLNPVSNFILSEEDAQLIRSLNEADEDVHEGRSSSPCSSRIDTKHQVMNDCQTESIIIFPEEDTKTRVTERPTYDMILSAASYPPCKKTASFHEGDDIRLLQNQPSHASEASLGRNEVEKITCKTSLVSRGFEDPVEDRAPSHSVDHGDKPLSEIPKVGSDNTESPWDAVQREVRAMETSVAYLCQTELLEVKPMTRSRTASTYSTPTQPAPCYDNADGKPPKFDSHERRRMCEPSPRSTPSQLHQGRGGMDSHERKRRSSTDQFDSHEQRQDWQEHSQYGTQGYRPPVSRSSTDHRQESQTGAVRNGLITDSRNHLVGDYDKLYQRTSTTPQQDIKQVTQMRKDFPRQTDDNVDGNNKISQHVTDNRNYSHQHEVGYDSNRQQNSKHVDDEHCNTSLQKGFPDDEIIKSTNAFYQNNEYQKSAQNTSKDNQFGRFTAMRNKSTEEEFISDQQKANQFGYCHSSPRKSVQQADSLVVEHRGGQINSNQSNVDYQSGPESNRCYHSNGWTGSDGQVQREDEQSWRYQSDIRSRDNGMNNVPVSADNYEKHREDFERLEVPSKPFNSSMRHNHHQGRDDYQRVVWSGAPQEMNQNFTQTNQRVQPEGSNAWRGNVLANGSHHSIQDSLQFQPPQDQFHSGRVANQQRFNQPPDSTGESNWNLHTQMNHSGVDSRNNTIQGKYVNSHRSQEYFIKNSSSSTPHQDQHQDSYRDSRQQQQGIVATGPIPRRDCQPHNISDLDSVTVNQRFGNTGVSNRSNLSTVGVLLEDTNMSPNTRRHIDSLTALQQRTASLLGIHAATTNTSAVKKESFHSDNPFEEMLRENDQLESQFLRQQIRELASHQNS